MRNNTEIKRILAMIAALVMTAALAVFAVSCGRSETSETAEAETEESYDSGLDVSQIGEFDTIDLQGGKVTQEIFGEADLTLINFWATFCGPCIQEMPELQELSEEYAGRVTFLGVVCDMEDLSDSDMKASAEKITTGQGVKFASVIPQGALKDIAYSLQYVPTTVIVDKNGNIIGSPIVGADVDNYKKAIEDHFANN